jgi:nuclear transport factor 2 (NTF2) superfamily protein
MVNRKPKHVASGGSRNRFYVCDNSFICNEYSSGAMESGVRVYALVENSTELFPQVSFKYDGYTNPEKPWFLSYSDENWENVSEEKFNERKKILLLGQNMC